MANSPIHTVDEHLFNTLARRYLKAVRKKNPSTTETLSSIRETLAQAVGHTNYHTAQAWWRQGAPVKPNIITGTTGPAQQSAANNDFELELFSLGFSLDQAHDIHRAISGPSNYALIAGVAGSGKSTIVKSIIQEQNRKRDHKTKIYTIEDPPEMLLSAQPKSKRGCGNEERTPVIASWHPRALESFGEALKISSDNIMMIGEIRNQQDAATYFETIGRHGSGATTIHASGALGIIDRMECFHYKKWMIDHALSGGTGLLIYSKLLAVPCPQCRLDLGRAMDVNEQVAVNIGQLAKVIDFKSSALKFINQKGCPACRHTGCGRRTAVAEVVVLDRELAQTIEAPGLKGDDWVLNAHEKHRKLRIRGVLESGLMSGRTAKEHAIYKATVGEVDITDVEEKFGPIG